MTRSRRCWLRLFWRPRPRPARAPLAGARRSRLPTSRWAIPSWWWTARSPVSTPRSPRSTSTASGSKRWWKFSDARLPSISPFRKSRRCDRPLHRPGQIDPVLTPLPAAIAEKKDSRMPPRKKVAALVKVALNAASATPAPPVGTALGPHGVNIMEFVKAYNAATESMRGTVIPVEITIYEDRSFTFITKTPPAAELIKKAAGVTKGSAVPQRDKVGKVTRDQVREIANTKLPDLNANDIESAMKIVEGTDRSMGVTVAD